MARQLAMISGPGRAAPDRDAGRPRRRTPRMLVHRLGIALAEGPVEGAVGGEHGLALFVVEFRQERRWAGRGGASFLGNSLVARSRIGAPTQGRGASNSRMTMSIPKLDPPVPSRPRAEALRLEVRTFLEERCPG